MTEANTPYGDTSWVADYDGLSAEQAIALAEQQERPYRVIAPGSVITLEMRRNRLNIHVDERGTVTRFTAG